MITYKPIIIPNNRKKDGTYPVKIRVYLNGKVRRLPTNLVCEQKDLTRSLHIKNPDILKKADVLIKRMRAITDQYSVQDLEKRSIDWLVIRINEGLKGEHFSLDFFEWGEKYILSKNLATRKAYERALNALERFLGERELDINDITKMMLLDFVEFVEKEPKMYYDRTNKVFVPTKKEKVAKTSSSLHLMKLQHIFNAAKDRYNDEDSDTIRIPRSPFDSIKKVFISGGKGQKALDRKVIQMLINAHAETDSERVAIDAFLVSFALMGANLADLYFATPVAGDLWTYNRLKTTDRRQDKAEMRVAIPPQIHPHLQRLQSDEDGGWWLPELHRIGEKKQTCNEKINDALRRWQKRNGVEDFTFYSARHSFATIARELGYDLASINECLCHKDNLEMGRIYASLTWEQKNAINKAVVESFEW
jgi:site-specific recombinase XerD